MSKLYGMVTGDRGKQTPRTAQASRNIVIWCQTETGRITISLNATGEYAVAVCPVEMYYPAGEPTLVASGTVPGSPLNGHEPAAPKRGRKPKSGATA